jgi:hypothetical protein
MPSIMVDQLKFEFPSDWQVSQFDEWTFYRNQFQKLSDSQIPCKFCGRSNASGTKGIDILAIQGDTQWYIEVKDYRLHRREKAIALADEVALKVRDTLAALALARMKANNASEQRLARHALDCSRIRVVVHLEQPAKHSKLFPRAINPADVKQRLKQLIKAIDPHPLVTELSSMHGVNWSVASVTNEDIHKSDD